MMILAMFFNDDDFDSDDNDDDDDFDFGDDDDDKISCSLCPFASSGFVREIVIERESQIGFALVINNQE